MKPRPCIVTFSRGWQPIVTRSPLQWHYEAQSRAFTTSFCSYKWHSSTRAQPQRCRNTSQKQALPIRHASSTATKPRYSPKPPVPVSSATAKTQVPAKPRPQQAPLPPAKTPSAHRMHVSTALPKTSYKTTIPADDRLNLHSTAYAPDLTVPTRQPDQSFFKYVWNAGRAYLSFYKAGVSNVRQTSKLAKMLREKVRKAGGKDTEILTRAEWQTIKRSRKDMLRLPAFGLIFLVFGEWTPLLVMYITPLIPEPCRIPSQVQKQLVNAENTRKDRLHWAGVNAFRLMAADRPKAGLSTTTDAKIEASATAIQSVNPLNLTQYELILASARYGCHSRIFDLLRVTPPKFWLQRGVRKQYEYLKKDDNMIERDGGFQALEKKEVRRACIERGFDVLDKKDDELRKALASWFAGKA